MLNRGTGLPCIPSRTTPMFSRLRDFIERLYCVGDAEEIERFLAVFHSVVPRLESSASNMRYILALDVIVLENMPTS